jgi:hypothetical protein
MNTAKLIIAAGFKMKEQARQDMAEEDLGGGMFDQDKKNMRDFAEKVALPQVYDADERRQLDVSLAVFHEKVSLRKYKTGTKLYAAEITDTGQDVRARVKTEVRGPVEQVVGYYMGIPIQFNSHMDRYGSVVVGERRNDHSTIVGGTIPMPPPLQKRHVVTKTLWEKLDDNTFFVTQVSVKHDSVPAVKNSISTTHTRLFKMTRIGPSLTKYVRH